MLDYLGLVKSFCIWVFHHSDFSGTVVAQSSQFLAVQFKQTLFSSDIVAIFVHASCEEEERGGLKSALPQFSLRR